MTTKSLPKTVAEWDHYLSGLDTPEKMNAAMASGEFKNATASFVNARNAERDDLLAQIKEQTEATMTDMLKEYGMKASNNLDLKPPSVGGVNLKYSALQNKNAVGTPLNGKFEDLADFLKTTWHLAPQNASTVEKLQILNAYQERVPSDGGYLVPEEFRAELLRQSLETAIVRPRARVVPMGSATLRFPAIDSSTNVGSVYGGIQAFWTEEGAELVESSGSFQSIKLEAQKLTALATVTNELVRDAAGGFGMYVETLFPEAITFFEDLAFISGNGVGQPLGALTKHAAMLTVAKETSQAIGTIKYANILKMYSRMSPTSLARAVWIVTPDAFVQLALMAIEFKNVAGTENVGGAAVWMPDASGTPTLTLLGRPVIMTEKAPAVLGTQGDISFVDLGMYLIGDRQQMEVESSAHVKFTSDKTVYRVIERVDGRPWLQNAITPANGGPTLSSFVQLADRTS